MEVLGGVLVLRRVAAADVAAGEAEPEVDPGVAHLQALLATPSVGFDVLDLIQVRTWGRRHRFTSQVSLRRPQRHRRSSAYTTRQGGRGAVIQTPWPSRTMAARRERAH